MIENKKNNQEIVTVPEAVIVEATEQELDEITGAASMAQPLYGGYCSR